MSYFLEKPVKFLLQSTDDLLSLIYPKLCESCGNSLLRDEECICLSCQFHLPKTNFYQLADNPVSRIFWGRVRLSHAAAYLYYNKGGNVQKMIHHLKYKGKKEIGVYLGKRFGSELAHSPHYQSVDIIMPIPLHPLKEKKRGYNQSLMIAEGLGESLNKPVSSNNLVRKFYSETQTKKTRYNRWENVKEIFDLTEPELLENKHVMLVDDVITTGATIEACCNVLKNTPNIRISVVSLACTVH